MDTGKNIQMEFNEEELQKKIEQITREIQETKEEGLRVYMATEIYKVATVTLDEDLASHVKRKKYFYIEIEDLQEKLDMLRLKVQEKEAREARVESETATLLAKSVSLDEEITVEIEKFTSMKERMAAMRKKNKNFHSNMIDKLQEMREKYPVYEQGANSGLYNAHPGATGEDEDEEIVYKPPFLVHLKGGD